MSAKLNRTVNNPYILIFSRLIAAPLLVIAMAFITARFERMYVELNTIQVTLDIKLDNFDHRIEKLEAWREAGHEERRNDGRKYD